LSEKSGIIPQDAASAADEVLKQAAGTEPTGPDKPKRRVLWGKAWKWLWNLRLQRVHVEKTPDGGVKIRLKSLRDVITVMPMMAEETHKLAEGLMDVHLRLRHVEDRLGIKPKPRKGDVIIPSKRIL